MRLCLALAMLAACAAAPTTPPAVKVAAPPAVGSRPAREAPRFIVDASWEPVQAAAAFDRAAALHKDDLRALYGAKQMRPPVLATLDRERVVAALTVARPDYPEGTEVLFYAAHDDWLEMWVVTSAGIRAAARVRPLSAVTTAAASLRAALGVDARNVMRGLHRRGLVLEVAAAAPPPLAPALRQLSELLLPKPIGDALAGGQHLVVVPALGLGTVPFVLLGPAGGSPLIDHMTVSIASSLYDLTKSFDPWRAPTPGASLVVGNPLFANHPVYLLPPLAGAEHEANEVAALLGSKPLLGLHATEDAVVLAASSAEIIHLATHGLSASEAALDESFLALAPGPATDGWWTGREIVSQSLRRTRLAVLSACQTGLGQVHVAGIIGLARAFQKAGVPRVIMSLWNVDDTTTAALMIAFTRRLATEMPAAALRHAMLEVRETRPDPALWAAFALFGTPR